MSVIRDTVRKVIPHSARAAIRRGLGPLARLNTSRKHRLECDYWDSIVAKSAAKSYTDYYRRFMLAMGNVSDQSFFDGKVCLDIGCGPMGSLNWLTNARAAIGLDPLAEQYTRFGIDRHPMIYLSSRAEEIPLVTGYVDVVFSMNSLDHVDNVRWACAEIRRVLKPGGHFIGSLNLDELPAPTEPCPLTEPLLHRHLFAGWLREFYEVRPKADDSAAEGEGADSSDPDTRAVASPASWGIYRYFREPCPPELLGRAGPKTLWCRLRVPTQDN